jgi:hypothetical protein
MVSNKQVRKLSKEYQITRNIVMSAMRSGMHRQAAAKYLNSGELPSVNISPERAGLAKILLNP